jgi:hypothetical protein
MYGIVLRAGDFLIQKICIFSIVKFLLIKSLDPEKDFEPDPDPNPHDRYCWIWFRISVQNKSFNLNNRKFLNTSVIACAVLYRCFLIGTVFLKHFS